MIKRYKMALTALLAVLLVFAVITVTGVVDINRMVNEKEEDETQQGENPTGSDDVFRTYSSAGLPLLATDVENVFYTMSKTGEVKFYKVNDAEIENIRDVESFDVTVTCSGQDLPVTIYHTEVQGKTLGYGLFTNENHPEVFLYDYAFFKLTDQFDAYDSKSGLLLLADIEKDRFYDENKVYSESFYLYENHDTKNFLNEDQRIVDLNARLRADYKMFTDDILHQESSKILFFSSRFYNDYGHSENVDIFISGGSGENVDNNRYVTDIASLNFWNTDDGIIYFVNKDIEEEDDEAAVSAFSLMSYDGSEETEIISFEGSIKEDFIVSGTHLLNIATGDIYNVLTGETDNFDYTEFEVSFVPDLFKVSENGRICVLRGKSNLGKPSLGIMDMKTGETMTFTENVFGHIASVQVLDDGTIILSLAASESAETYYQLVTSFELKDAADDTVVEETNEDATLLG